MELANGFALLAAAAWVTNLIASMAVPNVLAAVGKATSLRAT